MPIQTGAILPAPQLGEAAEFWNQTSWTSGQKVVEQLVLRGKLPLEGALGVPPAVVRL